MKAAKKNLNKKEDFISIILTSYDQIVHTSLIVNMKMTTTELINILNKKMLEYYSDKSIYDFYYYYNGNILNHSSFSLYQVKIRNGTIILANIIEGKNHEIVKEKEENINFNQIDLNNYIPEDLISLILISSDQLVHTTVIISKYKTCSDLIKLLYKHLKKNYPQYSENEFYFLYKGQKLNFNSLTLDEAHIENGTTILTLIIEPMLNENLNMEASIIINNEYHENFTFDLDGLLKLCLLKEISNYYYNDLEYYDKKIPNKIKYILEILSGGNIDLNQTQNSILSVLGKLGGQCNIINFSKFIDQNTNKEDIIEVYDILKINEKEKINEKKNCLGSYVPYMKKFETEFEKAKKESVFEYTINSLTIVDRENRLDFENEKDDCPNRQEKILFHGTGIKPCAKILTDMFKRSEKSGYQFGKGVYFTDSLDYAWYYGGIDHRANLNKIPKVEDSFVFVGSLIYYDKKGYKRVYDHKYQPKKNEINFALANAKTETIFEKNPNTSKFYGTEYVIYEKEQICPFIGCSVKRDEFCVIWRDVNFSQNPVYNNEFDELFKKFLKKRIEYIQEQVKFNVYPCETSEEALKLIKRKKYSKIILISNVGDDLSGKQFISDARKIIGSDVIALFLCYNKNHLNWIKEFKNALFSNDSSFYEEYLECFVTERGLDMKKKNELISEKIINLIKKMQKKYGVKFKFFHDFLNYPNFKSEGKFSDLTF